MPNLPESSSLLRHPYTVSGIALALGVSLILLGHLLANEYVYSDVIRDIGIAMFISGILGLSFELVFHQRLLEDTFKASIGYLLPPELRPEMEWIYTQGLMATEHFQRIELTVHEANTLIMNVKINRTLRNVSHQTVRFKRGGAIDKWFPLSPGAKFLSMGYRIGKKEDEKMEDDIPVEKVAHALVTRDQKPIKVRPNEYLVLWMEYQEKKHMNDATFITFSYPTVNPVVELRYPEGVEAICFFSHRGQAQVQHEGSGRYRLPATLLPNQHIQVRWWNQEEAEKWKSSP